MEELLGKPWFIVALVIVAGLGLLAFLRRPPQSAGTTVLRQEANLDPVVQLLQQGFGGLAQQTQETRQGILALYESQQSTLQQAASGILSALGETAKSQLEALNAGLKAIDERIINQFTQQQQFITTKQTELQQSIADQLKAQQEAQNKQLKALQDQLKAQSDVNALFLGQNSFLACYDAKVGWRRECLFAKGTFGRSGLEDISNLKKAEEESQKYAKCRKSDKTFDLLCVGRQLLQEQLPAPTTQNQTGGGTQA